MCYMRAPLCIYVCAYVYMCVRCSSCMELKCPRWGAWRHSPFVNTRSRVFVFRWNDFNIIVVSTFRIVCTGIENSTIRGIRFVMLVYREWFFLCKFSFFESEEDWGYVDSRRFVARSSSGFKRVNVDTWYVDCLPSIIWRNCYVFNISYVFSYTFEKYVRESFERFRFKFHSIIYY